MHLLTSLLPLALAATAALACPGDDHKHELRRRSSRGSTQPSGGTSLLRNLTWGEVNVIHTTDIHGWYQGHMKSSYPEPNFSGDWGDFASFVSHMKNLAKKKGVDLLLVDTGDLHDGAGLSDGFPAKSKFPVDGHVSNQFHSMVPYDVLSIGNHELYKWAVTNDVYKYFVPEQRGRYLASNVNISYADKTGQNVSVPVGARYTKFTTDQGRKVTAFGVLFNFTGNDLGTTVQDPAEMVKEAWFAEAIQSAPDLFLLTGHMPVRNDQFPDVINAIRAVHPDTPILVLGGHTHIRDCVMFDGRSMGLESGRYLETIGWMGVSGLKQGSNKNLTFSRTYIDANRRNYAFHAELSEDRFDTAKGKSITAAMAKVADSWNLTEVFGTAPQDYYLERVSANDSSSLINLFANKVLPTVISTSNPARNDTPNIVIANSGSQRFDVYSGPFTKNDEYIVSPFTDAFLYIRDVPWKYASQLVNALNNNSAATASSKRSTSDSTSHSSLGSLKESTHPHSLAEERELYGYGEVEHIYQRWVQKQSEQGQRDLARLDARAAEQATLGYVTKDSCDGFGDDTEHVAIPYVPYPDYVGSPLYGNVTSPEDAVDVVFVDFIVHSIVNILNGLQSAKRYSVSDAVLYNSLTTQDLYPLYAEAAWN